ncbi:MAG: flagellar hook-length control protein FliK [Betaproteobacteria bacterium]
MEAKLSFLSPSQVSPSAGEALPAATGAEAKAPATEFSQVLTGQMFKTQRQGIAATSATAAGLQVVPLGKSINVITSDAPLPDMASLASFARAQGLDEAAVQALFGPLPSAKDAVLSPPTAGIGLPTLATTSAQNLAELPGATVLATFSAAQTTTTEKTGLPAEDDATSQSDPPLADTAAVADASALALASVNAAGQAVAVHTVTTQAAPIPAAQSPGSAPTLSPLVLSGDNEAALLAPNATVGRPQAMDGVSVTALEITAASSAPLMPQSARAWIDATPIAKISDPTTAAEAATQSAVRLTLGMPVQEITKRLAQMSGTSKQVSWAALLESAAVSKDALAAPVTQETLQLDVPTGYQFDASDLNTGIDLGQLAPAGAAPNDAGAAASGTSGLAPSEKPSLQAQVEQRAVQFQQMADKLGEAAAQRLITQIERGQWKMQMRMQPGSLGRIDVQLDMHSGGLDALFSSDNAITRELITQGTNKLKDTLAQSGMAVASVWVNADQGRQSGGNSTPGQAYRGPQNAPNSPAPAQAAATAPENLGSKGSDGLNILA